MIDQQIGPGPYKELLPCIDLCYNLVQSCPASLGFACPLDGQGLHRSYGRNGSTEGDITCNYPGAAYRKMGEASGLERNIWVMMVTLLIGLSAGV